MSPVSAPRFFISLAMSCAVGRCSFIPRSRFRNAKLNGPCSSHRHGKFRQRLDDRRVDLVGYLHAISGWDRGLRATEIHETLPVDGPVLVELAKRVEPQLRVVLVENRNHRRNLVDAIAGAYHGVAE